MNLALLFDLVLGFGISFYTSQNDTRAASHLRKLQAAKASNQNIDAAMQRLADDLNAGIAPDWDAHDAALDAEVDEFLSRGSGGAPE